MNIARDFKALLKYAGDPGYLLEICRSSRLWRQPGHFYSPIPGLDDHERVAGRMAKGYPEEIPGVALNLQGQQALLKNFESYYREMPFPERKSQEFRYYFENPNYAYSDAIFLYSMIRHFRPRRLVEIGSGYSSCCILDTNQTFFSGEISCDFVEPFPELLYSLLLPGDVQQINIHPFRLQDVDLALFGRLEENDLLVIDSTHVLKAGSDVELIFAEILPRLQPGVLVHFHDIFYPFEYPMEWIRQGRAWNEAYALRAFLQYNDTFRVEFFNTYLEWLMPDYFTATMPLCLKNTGGSLWIRKVK